MAKKVKKKIISALDWTKLKIKKIRQQVLGKEALKKKALKGEAI